MSSNQNVRRYSHDEQPEENVHWNRAQTAQPAAQPSGLLGPVNASQFYTGYPQGQAIMSNTAPGLNNTNVPRALDPRGYQAFPHSGPFRPGVGYTQPYINPTNPIANNEYHTAHASGVRSPNLHGAQPFASVPSQAFSAPDISADFRSRSMGGPQNVPSYNPSVAMARPTSQGQAVVRTYGASAAIRATNHGGPEIDERRSVDQSTVASGPKLDPSFKRKLKSRKFFTVGKVFLTLWSEPAGDLESDTHTAITAISSTSFGESVFSKVRRFVVVGEGNQVCIALPILTYTGQGVSKKGVVKAEHAIIHTGKEPPAPLPKERPSRGEKGMLPRPIRVDPDEKHEQLDPLSRLDFAKTYTIQHNIKVRSLGKVHEKSMQPLLYQFKAVWSKYFGDSPLTGQRIAPQVKSPINVEATRSSEPKIVAAFNALVACGMSAEKARATLANEGLELSGPEFDDQVIDGESEYTTAGDLQAGSSITEELEHELASFDVANSP